MNEEKIIADAVEQQELLRKRAQFEMLRMGRKDTAEALADPHAKEMLGRSALARAIQADMPDERPKGPARRPKPKVNARKRQRQARKASR